MSCNVLPLTITHQEFWVLIKSGVLLITIINFWSYSFRLSWVINSEIKFIIVVVSIFIMNQAITDRQADRHANDLEENLAELLSLMYKNG